MMDIKKTFSPSTWGLRLSSVEALRAGELSILYPITTAYTIVYLGMMIADFVLKEAYTAPTAMMIAYGALLVAYAGDKEVKRWAGKEEPSRWGSFFVYAWFVFLLVVLIVSSIFKEFTAPADLVKVALEVLGVFFGSKASKKIYETKSGKDLVLTHQDSVLELIKSRGQVTRPEVQTALNLSRSSAGRLLDGLESSGIIKQVGKYKDTHYVLANQAAQE